MAAGSNATGTGALLWISWDETIAACFAVSGGPVATAVAHVREQCGQLQGSTKIAIRLKLFIELVAVVPANRCFEVFENVTALWAGVANDVAVKMVHPKVVDESPDERVNILRAPALDVGVPVKCAFEVLRTVGLEVQDGR